MPESLIAWESNPDSSPAASAAIPVAWLRAVHKRFGQIRALNGLTLQVHPGEVVALLGPNGAGKTTAISILLGLRRPDSGEVKLFGRDPRHPDARRGVGAVGQEVGFPPTLTVSEIVDLIRAHYFQPLTRREVLRLVGLEDLQRRQVGGLSSGQKRRLAVALAFAGRPQVLVLDEPTVGLDVESRRGIWQMIRSYARQGGTVLLTSHNLQEVEALATRIVLINHGQIVADGTVQEIRAHVGLKRVRFGAHAVPMLPGVSRLEREGDAYTLYTADADLVVTKLVQSQMSFQDLEVLPVSLEEAFLLLTRASHEASL